jgi:hypothetical protein
MFIQIKNMYTTKNGNHTFPFRISFESIQKDNQPANVSYVLQNKCFHLSLLDISY